MVEFTNSEKIQMSGRYGRIKKDGKRMIKEYKKNTDYKVNFYDNYRGLNGQTIRIEDRWLNVSDESAFASAHNGNIAAMLFATRILNYIEKETDRDKAKEITLESMDDQCILYGHINGLGYLVLMSELEEINENISK